MVEGAYENFLTKACKKQRDYKLRSIKEARSMRDPRTQKRKLNLAEDLPLNRCDELREFFPEQRQRYY